MIIGAFNRDKDLDTYKGDIVTLTWSRSSVMLVPNEKGNDKEPDYRVVWGSHSVEFGAAWKRTSKDGQEFLSVSLDDPALPEALNAALFHSEDGKGASLVWSRPKRKEAKAA